MKKYAFPAIFLIFILYGYNILAQSKGEKLFNATCATCHTVNKGRLVGPDLSGVYDKREQDWLIRFIRSSQQLVKEGDSLAVARFREFNRIPMPDNNLSNDEILGILDYIRAVDRGNAGVSVQTPEAAEDTVVTTPVPVKALSKELVEKGNALFYGYESFAGGPLTCTACHSLRDGSAIGGGKLSLDLTESYNRLGEAGIKAILTNPPFPVMKAALHKRKLTDDEIEALTALLRYAGTKYINRQVGSSGRLVFGVLGFVVAIFLLVHIYLFYDHRKIP